MKLNITIDVDCDPNDELDDEDLAAVETEVFDDIKDSVLEIYVSRQTDSGTDYQFSDVTVTKVEPEGD